jgi:hypothetical protein
MDITLYKDFLITCAGASASFIGLLFVALSVVLANKDRAVELEFTDRRLAESAFTSLAIIFFIALCALIPSANLGYIALAAACFGLRSSWLLLVHFKTNRIQHDHRANSAADRFWIGVSLAVYFLLALDAAGFIVVPSNTFVIDAMMAILLWLFGMGLTRSWALTGIRGA